MADLHIQNKHVPNSLLETAKNHLGEPFRILPKRIQLGYLALFLGNRYITGSNQHKTHTRDFKISKKDLGKLFGEYLNFRRVNHNGFWMRPRKTKSNTDQGLLALCSYSDNGAVHYDPLELIIQTYKGHNSRSDKGKKGEKGLLSAYQLTDRVRVLMNNWIDSPIIIGKDLRYMMDLKGHKIDMTDDNAFGIIRSKSKTSKDINIRLIVDVSLPGMLMYKLLLQLTHNYLYHHGNPILTRDFKHDKVLVKDSKLWNEIAIL